MKFVCDAMLGKLAKYLRILGLDAEYTKDLKILKQYMGQPDVPYLLTRTTKKITYERTIFLRSDKVREQLLEIREIIRPFVDPDKIMNRCIECNVELMDVEKNILNRRCLSLFFTSMKNSVSVSMPKGLLGGSGYNRYGGIGPRDYGS